MTRTILLFLHLLGFGLWLGGGFAQSVIAMVARTETGGALALITRVQAAIMRKIIAPGVVLVVLSGFILTMQLMTASAVDLSHWLYVMQGAGLIAAVLSLVVSLPSSARVVRLEPDDPRFMALRSKLRTVGMITGLLGLLALAAGVAYRMGY